MKKFEISLMVIVFMLVMTTSVVSAELLTIDNVVQFEEVTKTYDCFGLEDYYDDCNTTTWKVEVRESNYKKLKIVNTFGLGQDIAEVELITPMHMKISPGYQKVAEFNITGHVDYKDFISGMDFEDMKRNRMQLTKEYDLKWLNGYTNRSLDKPGYYSIEPNWEKLTPADMKKNENMTIALFVTAEPGDYVDWKPTFAGKKIHEWATYEVINTETWSYNALSGDKAKGSFEFYSNTTNGVPGAYLLTRSGGTGDDIYVHTYVNKSDGTNVYMELGEDLVTATNNFHYYVNFTVDKFSEVMSDGDKWSIEWYCFINNNTPCGAPDDLGFATWVTPVSYEGTYFSIYNSGNDALTWGNNAPIFTFFNLKEVVPIFNSTIDTDLIAYYRFDEESGTTAVDSANTQNGTIGGDVTLGVTGRNNTAFNFTGTGDSHVIIDGLTSTTGDYTLCAWMTGDADGTSTWFDTETGRLIVYSAASTDELGFYDGAESFFEGVRLNSSLHHYCMTLNSGTTTGQLWIDGVYNSSGTTAYASTNIGGGVEIGSNHVNGDEHQGVIDEMAIWERVLGGAEILHVYESYPATAAGDTQAPNWTTIPSNATFNNITDWAGVQFEATDDTGISGYQVNDTTNFVMNSTGFLNNNTALSTPGFYTLNVTVNDTSNNINWTTYSVNVTKYTEDLAWQTIPANASITSGEDWAGVTFVAIGGTIDQYIVNDTTFTMDPDTGVLNNASDLSLGTYNLNVSVNNTIGQLIFTEYQVEVAINSSACNVYTNETAPLAYPKLFTVFTDCSSAYTLTVDGNSVANNSIVNGGAAEYNLTVQRTNTVDYSNTYDSELFEVLQNTGTLNMNSALYEYTFDDGFQATCQFDGTRTSTVTMYNNGTYVDDSTSQFAKVYSSNVLPAGAYNMSCIGTDTQNYTDNYGEEEFRILKKTTTAFIAASNGDVVYGGDTPEFRYFISSSPQAIAYMYVNGTLVAQGAGEFAYTVPSGVGAYNGTVVIPGNQNFTYFFDETEMSITPSLNPMTVDYASASVVYGNNLNPSCEFGSPDRNVTMYINGTYEFSSITSGFERLLNSTVYPVGAYNVSCIGTDTVNFTTYYGEAELSFTKDPSDCQVLFSETSPQLLGSTFYAYTDCDSGFQMYRNGTLIGNNSLQTLGVGAYNFSVFRNDTGNYTNFYDEEQFIIGSVMSITLTSPIDNFVMTSPSVTFTTTANTSTSVVGPSALDIRNISIWTNSTGVWHLNSTLDGSAAASLEANDVTDVGPSSSPTDITTAQYHGYYFSPNGDRRFVGATKRSDDDSATAYLAHNNGTLIKTANYAANVADFGKNTATAPLLLDENTYIIYSGVGNGTDGFGSSHLWRKFLTNPLPSNTGNVTWTACYGSGCSTFESITVTDFANVFTAPITIPISNGSIWTSQACITSTCSFADDNRTLIYDTSAPVLSVTYPNETINYQPVGSAMFLNYTIVEPNFDNCSYNYNGVLTYLSTTDCKVTNYTTFNYVDGVNEIAMYVNDTFGNGVQETKTFDVLVKETDYTYTTPIAITYEADYDVTFTTNGTPPTEPLFYYDGVNIGTATIVDNGGDSYTLNYSYTPPSVGTYDWFFNFQLNPDINTTTYSQVVDNIEFSLCDDTNDEVYLNFTFKNEANTTQWLSADADIIATYWVDDESSSETYLATIAANRTNYTFCFIPPEYNVTIDLEFKYSNTGYPLRTFSYDAKELSNVTTDRILYMLDSLKGSYATIQVVDSVGSSIDNVFLDVQKIIDGSYVEILSGFTDDAGSIQFWVNPDDNHIFTATKESYPTTSLSVRPTEPLYTIVMGNGSGYEQAYFTSSLAEITWDITPGYGNLAPNTLQNFTFSVHSNYTNLNGVKIDIYGKDSLIDEMYLITTVNTTGTNQEDLTTFAYINISNNVTLFADFSINKTLYGIGGSTGVTSGWVVIDGNRKWIVTTDDIPIRGTLRAFFTNIGTSNHYGTEEHRMAYTRMIMFFLILFIVLGFLSYTTNWDFGNAGGSLLLVLPLVFFGSIGGLFNIPYEVGGNILASDGFLAKYTILLLTAMFSIGYGLSQLSKERRL